MALSITGDLLSPLSHTRVTQATLAVTLSIAFQLTTNWNDALQY